MVIITAYYTSIFLNGSYQAIIYFDNQRSTYKLSVLKRFDNSKIIIKDNILHASVIALCFTSVAKQMAWCILTTVTFQLKMELRLSLKMQIALLQ